MLEIVISKSNNSDNITLLDQDFDKQILGIEGDLALFVANILSNAKERGKATKIEIFIESKNGKIYLVIQDNGSGIDEKKFPNINDIFTSGLSGSGSSGIGLRDTEERGIKVTVSNEGLQNKETSTLGARFEIELETL